MSTNKRYALNTNLSGSRTCIEPEYESDKQLHSSVSHGVSRIVLKQNLAMQRLKTTSERFMAKLKGREDCCYNARDCGC